MRQLTCTDLSQFSKQAAPSKQWIRVGMDTGGIAAGADDVMSTLQAACEEAGLDPSLKACGSWGYSFADPVIMVKQGEGDPITYGAMDIESARQVVGHLQTGRLLEDHVIATRDRKTDLGKGNQTIILVKDTSLEGGDKTAYFQQSFVEELKVHGMGDDIQVCRALDMGLYDEGLCVQLLPSRVTYSNVLSPDIRRIITESLQNRRVVEDLLVEAGDPQVRIVLRNCGNIDPENLDDYLGTGGYSGLRRALELGDPDASIEDLKVSGLRGRGGAGFPTWLKWKLTREPESSQKYVICNADEGDPGAFMDRSVLESDPHSVLEGLMIAAYCIGASKGYLYIRAEYPLAVKRVQRALDDARAAGILGPRVLGTAFSFDAEVRLGAGAFVCGEETALIASIEGRRGSPEPRPPYPSVQGLWGRPTSINNVETLAAVSAIFQRGGEWYARHGTEQSRGTKVFAVTGKVKHSQLVEVPMGLPIRTIVEDICGGVLDDEDLKAVQTGGPSGGVIPQKYLDTPVTYENLKELGSIMGSGGMLVLDAFDCMVDVAKFYLKFCVDESCGKCAPCRVGGYQMLQILEKIYRGRGEMEDLDSLQRICASMQTASLCGLGQTAPNPVLSTLRFFQDEYQAYIEGGTSYARKKKKQLAEVGRKVS